MSRAFDKIVTGLRQALADATTEAEQCETGKRQYATRAAAQIARGSIQKRSHKPFRISVFICDKCHQFHLGRDKLQAKHRRKPIVKAP